MAARAAKKPAAAGQIETKEDAAPPAHAEVKGAVDDLARTFEAFKEANDRELAELKAAAKQGSKAAADPVSAEKTAKINEALDVAQKRLDELGEEIKRAETAAQRPWGASVYDDYKSDDDDGGLATSHEIKAAFVDFVRSGDKRPAQALYDEGKSLSSLVQPDGGYLVPTEVETDIMTLVEDFSPMRMICDVQDISTAELEMPVDVNGDAAVWASEKQTRAETDTPQIEMIVIRAQEMYAMPQVTQTILEDAAIDVEAWITDKLARRFGISEGVAFIAGDGVKRPRGFLAYPTVANASWTWGKVGYTITGENGGFVAPDGSTQTSGGDALINLTYELRREYRARASFIGSRRTFAMARKLKDTEANYIWQPSLQAGQPAQLMGYPVLDMDHMPDPDTGTFSLALGDFAEGYQIVDRVGMDVRRLDHQPPYVSFYARKRTGGGIKNFDAIKLLKFSAT